MNEEQYLRHKPFAGPLKPSMQRRAIFNDYHARRIYLLTVTTVNRYPWLGKVVGRTTAPRYTLDYPHIVPSPLGLAVLDAWRHIPDFVPEISIVDFQLMPDHLHGILFVHERMARHLGNVVGGFKKSCNAAFRRIILHEEENPKEQRHKDGNMLWQLGYNDRLLNDEGQMERWRRYLHDNPYRLMMKREHRDLFRVQHNFEYAGYSFSAIGNRFLLDYPEKKVVQCSRRLTAEQIEAQRQQCLKDAARGVVFISPSISPGEKTIMRSLFLQGCSLIHLRENGFTDYSKPTGRSMQACAEGRLLLLAPWEHHNARTTIRRDQCLSLNEMAKALSEC